jgi:hypothetical protein
MDLPGLGLICRLFNDAICSYGTTHLNRMICEECGRGRFRYYAQIEDNHEQLRPGQQYGDQDCNSHIPHAARTLFFEDVNWPGFNLRYILHSLKTVNLLTSCATTSSQSVTILALQNLFCSFGRWWTEQSWQTDLLCTWGVKGQIFVLFGPPISYQYSCTRHSLLAFRLKITPTINKQMSYLHWGPSAGCRRDLEHCDVSGALEHGFWIKPRGGMKAL